MASPRKTLTKSDARITTATVEIQVMRIGSKQMTLAVFRQLPYKDIFNTDGNLRARPWGWVNYHHEDSRPFVFEYLGALYRSDVDLEIYSQLKIEPETQQIEKEVPMRYDERKGQYICKETEIVPTGKWLIVTKDFETGIIRNPFFRSWFQSEGGATMHLANRLKALKILEAAPQLFIAV